jgi:hypothetical protein
MSTVLESPTAGLGERRRARHSRWAVTFDPGSSSGRTPRSERGDRGSTPCPGVSAEESLRFSSCTPLALLGPWTARLGERKRRRHSRRIGIQHGRLAQLGERLSYKQEAGGSKPSLPTFEGG